MIDWTKSNAEILTELDADAWVPSGAAVVLSTIRSVLPPDAYAMVRLTLEQATAPTGDTPQERMIAAELSDAVAAMRTVGLSLSSLDRQAVIDQLASLGGWPDAVRDAVKALGGVWQKQWSIEGYDALPSDDAVTEHKAKLARQAAHDAAIDIINDMKAAAGVALDNGDDPLVAAGAVWEAANAGE